MTSLLSPLAGESAADPRQGGISLVRVIDTDPELSGLTAGHFLFAGRAAALALAFVSPHVDFAAITASLAALGGATPVLAVSTAGELHAAGGAEPLYRPTGEFWSTVIVQIFSPDLLQAVSIRAVLLHSEDIRSGAPSLLHDERIDRIARSLGAAVPDFSLDARDSLALTFVDGLSASENYLMEAVYRTGRFPCLFVGGSAGGAAKSRHSYLFDGRRVVENHAVIAFLKLAPGKRYGVLKSQNFRKTGHSFVVVDADPDRRIVATVLEPASGAVVPLVEALSATLGTSAAGVMEALSGYSFGIELDGELFVRSVSRIDPDSGHATFFCDVNQGDELLLLQATDFAEQTRCDISAFLRGKPRPLAAILNDCSLRRVNNERTLADLAGVWPMPVAGFSTFGELLGININQTLTAVVFFDAAEYHDDFVDAFPIHYARFHTYFIRGRLNRIEVLNRLRSTMTRHLSEQFGASPSLARDIEALLTQSTDIRATMKSIRSSIAHQLDAENRAHQAERQLADAIETISDGFALYDRDDRLVICNTPYRKVFEGQDGCFLPGQSFAEIIRAAADRGIYAYEGRILENFLAARLAQHRQADGSTHLYPMTRGRWVVGREYRTGDGGIVAIRTDITELKQREEEMERLKRRYELILGSAGDGIIGITAEETIIFANPAACRMLGEADKALEGTNYRKALGGPPGVNGWPAFPLDGEVGISGEGRCGGARGGFVAEYRLTPIRTNLDFDGAVLVFRDISLRKQYEAAIADQQKALERQVDERTRTLSAEIERRSLVEEALRKSQGRLLGISSHLFEGVLLVDGYGHILFANPSAHRLLADETGHLLGTDLDEVMRVLLNGEIVGFAGGPFHRTLESGDLLTDDDAVFLLIRAQRRLSVGFAAAPLVEDGKRCGVVISFRSIEALKEAQREALQSSRLASVGQLAAGVAHEINTPIQYVGDNLRFMRDSLGSLSHCLTSLQALVEGTGQAEQARRLCDGREIPYLLEELPLAAEQSLQGIEHVAHIVRSLKEFSHPGNTAQVMTDINRAVDSTLAVSRNEWKHVATVETDLDPALPSIPCFAAEISQVLLNLVVNAADAIASARRPQPGIIRISTRRQEDAVEIRVADDGPGVPESIRERIFDPFFTTKEVGKGTGQGLSICLDVVVKKHKGRFFLDPAEGPGATFVVRLPLGGQTVPPT